MIQSFQPIGTKIYMSDGTLKNIEDINIGDSVVSYKFGNDSKFGSYYNMVDKPLTKKLYGIKYSNLLRFGTKVCNIQEQEMQNFIKVTLENGNTTYMTPEKICYVRYNQELSKNKFILYLMKNEKNMFRIGETILFNNKQSKSCNFGLEFRMNSEKCNYGWILDILDDKDESKYLEYLNSMIYKIPRTVFSQERVNAKMFKDDDIINLYLNLKEEYNIEEYAIQLLKKYNKDISIPFETKNIVHRNSKYYATFLNAINLFPKIIDFAIFDKSKKLKYSNIIKIEHIEKKMLSYSIDVERTHNYVADGCFLVRC